MKINKEEFIYKLLKWLYIHDGGYSDKLGWRKDFINEIERLLNEETN